MEEGGCEREGGVQEVTPAWRLSGQVTQSDGRYISRISFLVIEW